MKRHELEHLIRAAGAITGSDEIIVIGSQAILGARPDAPPSLLPLTPREQSLLLERWLRIRDSA